MKGRLNRAPLRPVAQVSREPVEDRFQPRHAQARRSGARETVVGVSEAQQFHGPAAGFECREQLL